MFKVGDIRNGYPARPHLQPCAYKDNKEIYVAIRDWGEKGKLNDLQQKLLLSPERAKEERVYSLAEKRIPELCDGV